MFSLFVVGFCFVLFFFFDKVLGSQAGSKLGYVAQNDLALRPLPPQCWNYRLAPHSVYKVFEAQNQGFLNPKQTLYQQLHFKSLGFFLILF